MSLNKLDDTPGDLYATNDDLIRKTSLLKEYMFFGFQAQQIPIKGMTNAL